MADLNWQPTWNTGDVEIKQNDLVWEGFFKVRRFELRHRAFSGEWSPWVAREQIYHHNAVAVILVDPKTQSLILVEQFRTGSMSWLLEIVAGLSDTQEAPIETAKREVEEETGCQASHLQLIGEFYNSPGGFLEKTTLFLAHVDANQIQKFNGVSSEHEDIRVHVLPIQAVIAAWDAGKLLTSASTVIALQWLKSNRK